MQPAVDQLATAGTAERGAIYTRREVVEFILDLVGYTTDKPLHQKHLLEPSFGAGDFLVVAVERLLSAYQTQCKPCAPTETLKNSVRAVELHRDSYQRTRCSLFSLLQQSQFSDVEANALLDVWLIQGDFLLEPLPFPFTHVVGNPPYVRQELIPDVLLAEYRRLYPTLYDRADLYIPFIEKSLNHLDPTGSVGFICSDRWMKNRYGAPLRALISQRFHLACYVDMVDTDAFHDDVAAYPAITVINRSGKNSTRVAMRPEIESELLAQLAHELRNDPAIEPLLTKEIEGIVQGAEPWILDAFDQLALVRRLENDFPTLEGAGCKVGIGVATGADKVYIAPYEQLDIENGRKLPLVMTRDINSGTVEWRGLGIVNPFEEDGSLAELDRYPRFAEYLQRHEATIRQRNVAKKNPQRWYRTIDRIYPELANIPKLLIPDIKGDPHIVYEDGRYYPHHNLYFITSTQWDLKALQAILMSGIARLFVSTYSTRMRGGYMRFQAQYLRRIRVPMWDNIPSQIQQDLIKAAQTGSGDSCNEAVCALYKLTNAERTVLLASQ